MPACWYECLFRQARQPLKNLHRHYLYPITCFILPGLEPLLGISSLVNTCLPGILLMMAPTQRIRRFVGQCYGDIIIVILFTAVIFYTPVQAGSHCWWSYQDPPVVIKDRHKQHRLKRWFCVSPPLPIFKLKITGIVWNSLLAMGWRAFLSITLFTSSFCPFITICCTTSLAEINKILVGHIPVNTIAYEGYHSARRYLHQTTEPSSSRWQQHRCKKRFRFKNACRHYSPAGHFW